MIELNVPFVEKDQVKNLGARWNAINKKWFVPNGLDPDLFKKWWPADHAISVAAPKSADLADPKLPEVIGCELIVFLQRIRNVINQNFKESTWVIAEISELTNHNGNYYLDLVQYDELGQKQAQVNAKIWRETSSYILDKFQAATDSALTAGIKVLVLVSVNFHQQYGLSLTIADLDPNYTLGDMAAKIRNIQLMLQQQQIYENNKKLTAPKEFTRVAVISPNAAAGLGDFKREAELLAKYNLCEWQYFTATFQGKAAGQEISNALAQVLQAHQQTAFDALVIIRGGGSVADLAWLNDFELAKAICLCPIYTIVGIGHKRDYTILDAVAALSCDTPSKVINYIFNAIVNNAKAAQQAFIAIVKAAEQTLTITQANLDQTILYIKQEVLHNLSSSAQYIKTILQQISNSAADIIKYTEQQLQSLIREILCQDPAIVLKKGFALVRSRSGAVISSYANAMLQQNFAVQFYDGVIPVIPEIINDSDKGN